MNYFISIDYDESLILFELIINNYDPVFKNTIKLK